MPLFRGTFFRKVRNYRYQFLKYVWNYRNHLEKHAELWVSFWENIAKLLGFTDEIYVILRFWVKACKNCTMIILNFKNVICFAKLWVRGL